jgi:hypothetical protein
VCGGCPGCADESLLSLCSEFHQQLLPLLLPFFVLLLLLLLLLRAGAHCR